LLHAAFFDLDGCLVDSRAGIVESIELTLQEVGLAPQPDAEMNRFIGPPLKTSFEHLLDEEGRDPALAEACVDIYRQHYRERVLEGTTAIPGISDALKAVGDLAPLVVVTSKPREFAVQILDGTGLDRYFSAVFGPSLRAMDETKVVTLTRALTSLDVPTARDKCMWMVGDRRHDVVAGRRCGLATAGVTWGFGDRPELEAAGATTVVDTPLELPSALDCTPASSPQTG
jgi:phosphoglycolate phosphatase